MTLFLGLDIGGTKSAALIGDSEGKVLERRQWSSLAARGPEAMISDLIANGTELLKKHPGAQGVGAVIGGPLDSAAGVILSPPNLPGWDRIPLRQLLQDAWSLPAGVEHDASACALAEYRWGAGREAARLAYLTCGTGFGLGLVVDGRIYRGALGRASDFGHIRYRADGPDAYGKPGCLEGYAAGGALGRLAQWLFPTRWPTPPAGTELSELAAAGDPDALAVIRTNALAVGDGCALLADMLYVDCILLGSLARYLGEPWIQAVRARFQAEAHEHATSICRIAAAGLGERLQDCSALAAAMSCLDPQA